MISRAGAGSADPEACPPRATPRTAKDLLEGLVQSRGAAQATGASQRAAETCINRSIGFV